MMACTYIPLQQSLLTYLGQGQGHDVDLHSVVTHLFNQRLLKPEYMLRVLETLELDGARAAAVHMMASLYATWADMLKDEYNDRMGDRDAVAAGIMAEPAGGDYPFWLTALVQIVEAHGGQGFSETVPESMLSVTHGLLSMVRGFPDLPAPLLTFFHNQHQTNDG